MIKTLLLNKQILLALGMIVFIGAVLASGTGAFFSSQASAVANSFTAGTLDLKLTSVQGGSNPEKTKSAEWSFSNMVPGGTPSVESVWLRNTGSIEGASLAVDADILAGGGNQDRSEFMRIAEMTLDGSNLLEGGAGATIGEYTAPVACDITVGGSGNPDTITEAIGLAFAGDVICATGSNYSQSWESSNGGQSGSYINVSKSVTIASVNGPASTSVMPLQVNADNVKIMGFNIVSPANGVKGVLVSGRSNVTVAHNTFVNFGFTGSAQNDHVVYLDDTNTALSNVVIEDNLFTNLVGGTSKSMAAIFIGDSDGATNMDDVVIRNNIIDGVTAGSGAYGVLLNHVDEATGGVTNDALITHNTIKNLHGSWTHAVGLEGRINNPEVSWNDFSNLTAAGADVAAIFFEKNPYASSAKINSNNFESGMLGVALHPTNQVGVYTIDATENWWGDFDSSDQVYGVNSNVQTNPIAGGPVSGFVGGTDANGNGFADLHDLMTTGIVDITPGLDPWNGTNNDKEFVMAVQLDASADDTFQGQSVTGVDINFTLNQI
jgi:predicted ribosomally synthesized peptide with SipW-like signal peptide